jgi:hypothetical protein
MRLASSSSWELRFDVLKAPHIVLFVRDALRFGTDDGRQPPRLEGDTPDLRALVDEQERRQLALGYRSWWQEEDLIDSGMLTTVKGPEDLARRHRELEAWSADFYAPLVPHRELRRQASEWCAEHRERYEPRVRDPETARARWETARDAAQAASTELGVAPGELSVNTWLIMVRGLWWATPRPGQLLYSPAVQEDRSLLRGLLQDAFGASVNR